MRAETPSGLIRVSSQRDWERAAREFFETTCDEAIRLCRHMGKLRKWRRAASPLVTTYRRNEAGTWDVVT